MKGLLYKDVSIMTRSFKGNILLLVALYGVLILVTKEAYLAYAMTAVWGIYVASTINYDEQAHWDAYAATLPVTPGQVIGSKYLLCAASTAIGAVLSLALVFAGRRWRGRVHPRHPGLRRGLGADERAVDAHHLPLWCGQVARVFNGHCVCYRFRGVFCRAGEFYKTRRRWASAGMNTTLQVQNRPYSGRIIALSLLVDCCALCHQLHHLCARLREKGKMKNLRSAFTQGAGTDFIAALSGRMSSASIPYKMPEASVL